MSSEMQCHCRACRFNVSTEIIDLCSPEKQSVKRLRRDLGDLEDTPYKCPICMENVRRRQPAATPCGHVFCIDCIQKAIEDFKKCPMCEDTTETAGAKKRISFSSIFAIPSPLPFGLQPNQAHGGGPYPEPKPESVTVSLSVSESESRPTAALATGRISESESGNAQR
ncbi:GM20261 [Drosophila sechellia]|uniref:GM20261 n=1 Tax=Drosophila sechellia TaxID=7238 RepID=B4HQL8_DROSE|nr:GM20261 [Drosophila sechellia]